MTYQAYSTLVMTLGLMIVSCDRYAVHVSRIDSDSGIDAPPYHAVQEELQNLASTYGSLATLIHYGVTAQNRELSLLKIQKSILESGGLHAAVLITEATHGNESLDLVDRMARRFLEQLDKADTKLPGLQQFIDGGGIVYLVPVFNPDGYELHQRLNANYRDLNRDYPDLQDNLNDGFTQKETKAIGQFLEDAAGQGVRLKLSLDYHCCGGMILYPWSHQPQGGQPPKDLKTFQHVARDIMLPALAEDYGIGTPLEEVGYEALNSSIDYYYLKYGTLAFGFEGRGGSENSRLDQHVKMWDDLLLYLSATPR